MSKLTQIGTTYIAEFLVCTGLIFGFNSSKAQKLFLSEREWGGGGFAGTLHYNSPSVKYSHKSHTFPVTKRRIMQRGRGTVDPVKTMIKH